MKKGEKSKRREKRNNMKKERKMAAKYAKIALQNGPSTTTLKEILIEEKMSKIRYALRIIGKFI